MAAARPPANDTKARAQQLTERDRRHTLFDLITKSEDQLKAAAGKILDVRRQIQLARTMISRNPTLGECTPLSIVNGILQATQLGLELDGIIGHAYLVPFKNHGRYEAQCLPGYRGYILLMHRSGRVQGIHMDVVRMGDRFAWQKGTSKFLHHRPLDTGRGELTHAYAVVHYRGGGNDFEVLPRERVEALRARSPAWRWAEANGRPDTPWHTDEEVMWKKSAVRQLAKIVPLSPQAQHAALLEDYHDAGLSVDLFAGASSDDVIVTEVDAGGEKPASKSDQLASDLGGEKPPPPTDAAREPGAEG